MPVLMIEPKIGKNRIIGQISIVFCTKIEIKPISHKARYLNYNKRFLNIFFQNITNGLRKWCPKIPREKYFFILIRKMRKNLICHTRRRRFSIGARDRNNLVISLQKVHRKIELAKNFSRCIYPMIS